MPNPQNITCRSCRHTRSRLRGAAAQPLIIDSHVHVWNTIPAILSPPARIPRLRCDTGDADRAYETNGVSRTVIIQVIHYVGITASRGRPEALSAYFKGVCRVNPEDPAAPEHLAATTEQGFRGVRLSPSANAARRLDSWPAHGSAVEALRGAESAHDRSCAGFAHAATSRP